MSRMSLAKRPNEGAVAINPSGKTTSEEGFRKPVHWEPPLVPSLKTGTGQMMLPERIVRDNYGQKYSSYSSYARPSRRLNL
jgi:hypothetical protein